MVLEPVQAGQTSPREKVEPQSTTRRIRQESCVDLGYAASPNSDQA
jgi:hypothetical protein